MPQAVPTAAATITTAAGGQGGWGGPGGGNSSNGSQTMTFNGGYTYVNAAGSSDMFETPSSYSFLSQTSVSAGQTITFTDASGNVLATFTLPHGSAEMVMCSKGIQCRPAIPAARSPARHISQVRTTQTAAATAEPLAWYDRFCKFRRQRRLGRRRKQPPVLRHAKQFPERVRINALYFLS